MDEMQVVEFMATSEDSPTRYQDEYSKLRSWTYSSLDLYKHELLHVLYLVFIHCFMDLVAKKYIQEARTFFNTFREDHEMLHLRDLQKLEGVLPPSHLEEMEFAHSLRHNKVNIKICQYSYELIRLIGHSHTMNDWRNIKVEEKNECQFNNRKNHQGFEKSMERASADITKLTEAITVGDAMTRLGVELEGMGLDRMQVIRVAMYFGNKPNQLRIWNDLNDSYKPDFVNAILEE
ncbi:hypothetical protein Ddye_019667 [Dipteronia dyeriana]|uniref:TFIID subunit TAF5 NTD2 domain-containing protein n=1 Tax=Dipteronia dyeriana TaxID=168575 RepID=A0AAD9TYT6_9ROSI|nr:hypothetical protein Ddye_019667 [Dipteronia dyeriana]